MKRKILTVVMSLSLGVAMAQAQKGRDYDEDEIEITSNATVHVTAQNVTKNHRSGNTSSVILYVNGAERNRDGGDRGNSQTSVDLTGKGKYKLRAVCDNTGADADRCTIVHEAKAIKTY